MKKYLILSLIVGLNLTACEKKESSMPKLEDSTQKPVALQKKEIPIQHNQIVNVHEIDIAKQNTVFLLDNKIELSQDEKIIINNKEYKIDQYFPNENGGGFSKAYLIKFKDKKLTLIALSNPLHAGGACIINAILDISPTHEVKTIQNSIDQIISNNDVSLDKNSVQIHDNLFKFALYTEQSQSAKNYFYYEIKNNQLFKIGEKIAQFDQQLNYQKQLSEGWYIEPALNGLFRDNSKYNLTLIAKIASQNNIPYAVVKRVSEHQYALTEEINSGILFGPFQNAETAQKQVMQFMNNKIAKSPEEIFISPDLMMLINLKNNGHKFSETFISNDEH